MIKKLFSYPLVQKLTALIVSGVFRLWMGTLSIRFQIPDPGVNPAWSSRPMLFVFWHESLVLPAYTHSRFNCLTLISRHRDGELLTQVLRMLRAKAIRGSTTRQSLPALREMIRSSRRCNVVIAPDGPRGPRRVFQQGAVFLASRTGMPIVAAAWAADRAWRLGSWDRMLVPKPFARAVMLIEPPTFVPPDADRQQLELYGRQLEESLNRLNRRAEEVVAGTAAAAEFISLQAAQAVDGRC